MFILSQAIIPMFVLAVLMNFYHFNPILSMEVGENFTTCDKCINSPCHKESNQSCAVNADNTTFSCFSCPEQDGNKQYFYLADCLKGCKSNNTANCKCDGKCYVCVMNSKTDTSKFKCNVPVFKMDETCKNMVQYEPPASLP